MQFITDERRRYFVSKTSIIIIRVKHCCCQVFIFCGRITECKHFEDNRFCVEISDRFDVVTKTDEIFTSNNKGRISNSNSNIVDCSERQDELCWEIDHSQDYFSVSSHAFKSEILNSTVYTNPHVFFCNWLCRYLRYLFTSVYLDTRYHIM